MAFVNSQRLYCYKAMPFSLKNARATYQRLVNHIFSKQVRRNMKVYVDNMLVKIKKAESHLDVLREIFDTLRKYQIRLNPEKCVFGVSSGKFLGFMVSQWGIEANLEKVRAILDMTSLRSVKEVQRLTRRIATLNRFISRATNKCPHFLRHWNRLSSGQKSVK